MKKAQEIIEDLSELGYDNSQIADAMLDGEYLKEVDIDQDTAEKVYDICLETK